MNAADDGRLAAVVVIGHQAAHDLFPDGKPLGRLFKVNQVWLRVVGVLSDRDLGQNKFEGVALGADSNTVCVPLSRALARFRFQPMEDQVSRFLLRLKDPDSLASGARVLSELLDQRCAGVSD